MRQRESLVPGWVYSLADYQLMFDLSDIDLNKKILDYPGGISSFNAEMHKQGHQVLSGDEIYALDSKAMQSYVDQLAEKNPETLRKYKESYEAFLQDYSEGQADGRYKLMQMPHFPCGDREFELALCTDLLFHTQAQNGFNSQELVIELLRVADEVRVFPLLNDNGEVSEEVGPILLILQQQNYGVEVRQVPYQQHKDGNAMLRIWATECVVS